MLIGRFLRFDFIGLFILAWLLGNGDMHVVLAQAGLLGILFSQIRIQLKWIGKTQGAVKKIIQWVVGLQFATFVLFVFLSWLSLANLRASGLLDQSMRAYRLEYLILAYAFYQLLILIVLTGWGHFYFRRPADPSVWNLKYSSVLLIPQFFLNGTFQKIFEAQVTELFNQRVRRDGELRSDDPVYKIIPQKLRDMQKQETEFLTLAKKMIE